jgi:hypothetical protein
MNKTGVRRKMFITTQMRQVDFAAAEHLLSPFSSPFFRGKWLYDYGFNGRELNNREATIVYRKRVLYSPFSQNNRFSVYSLN